MTASPSAGSGARFAFLNPVDGDVLLGPTEFRFRVEADNGDDAAPVDRIDVWADGRLIGSAAAPGWSLHWDAPAALSVGRVRATAYAGVQPVATRSIRTISGGLIGHVSVDAVQLYPVVRDRSGRYVSGLRREDFVVLDEGEPVELDGFAHTAESLGAGILLDVSASMEGELVVVQQAASRFIERLGEDDAVAMFAFNHRLHRAGVAPDAHADGRRWLLELEAGGGTALYDALVLVLDELGRFTGRKVAVLFSDGRDSHSLTSLARAAQVARANEVILYPIARVARADHLAARSDLRLLAKETGGEAHFFATHDELERAFDSILNDVRAQYSLSFTPPAGARGERRVEVKVRQAGYQVRCRRTYELGGLSSP